MDQARMRKIIAVLFLALALQAAPLHAQSIGYVKPTGVPEAIVPGNTHIAVFATVDLATVREFFGVFEQSQADGKWYFNGSGTTPLAGAALRAAIDAQPGPDVFQRAQNYMIASVLPEINADIVSVYYGTPSLPKPPDTADALYIVNYQAAVGLAFKSVNGVQTLGIK